MKASLRKRQVELASLRDLTDKDPVHFAKMLEMGTEIEEFEREISKLETNQEENDYYLKNGDIIFEYFQNINEIAENNDAPLMTSSMNDTMGDGWQSQDVESNSNIAAATPAMSVYGVVSDASKYLQKEKSCGNASPDDLATQVDIQQHGGGQPQDNIHQHGGDQSFTVEDGQTAPFTSAAGMGTSAIQRHRNIHEWVNSKDTFKRADCLDRYMTNIDPQHAIPIKRSEDDICFLCNSPMIVNQNEGMLECHACGNGQYVKVDSDKRSYREAGNTDMSYIAYKRINHFGNFAREWNSSLKMCFELVSCLA